MGRMVIGERIHRQRMDQGGVENVNLSKVLDCTQCSQEGGIKIHHLLTDTDTDKVSNGINSHNNNIWPIKCNNNKPSSIYNSKHK